MAATIGIDVGGTFTDFVLADAGRLVHHKEPTRVDEPAQGVAVGVGALLRLAQTSPGAIERVVHGTTLGLNALLQRRGARVALVVSRGFGDMLELGRGDLPNSYDYKAPKPVPAIPRERVLEVSARLRPDGSVVLRPDAVELDAIAARLRVLDVAGVAVSVLNAYLHPALEDELVAALAQRLPGIAITSAARLWPEVREYERTLVAVLNAMVQPLLDRYYAELETRLAGLGLGARLYVTTSSGGSMSAATARARPVETLLSGPAAGAHAASRVASEAGIDRLVAIDMGGTSSDLCLAIDGKLAITSETKLGDFPLMLPAVDMRAIGAGGGSIVWRDAEGVLKVGPRSAGAEPGPVCYARGGSEPALTDCFLVAGYLDGARFLGGRIELAADLARRALEAFGFDSAEHAAAASLRIATSRMAAEIGKAFARVGHDPRRFTLMPYGGAGPLVACALAESVGVSSIVIPAAPATFCALGAALVDARRDLARSRRIRIGVDDDAGATLAATVAEMEREAQAWAAGEGGAPLIAVTADMQYPRTAAVLDVAVPEAIWRRGDAAALGEAFHRAHEAAYGFRDGASAIDVTTLRLTVTCPRPPFAARAHTAVRVEPDRARRVFWRDRWLDCAVVARAAIGDDRVVQGPAIIEQSDTTSWIAPGWQARHDASGNLRLTRESSDG